MPPERCIDHLEFTNQKCPDCGLDVDQYGNTEDQFDFCSFPDCGCDGSRNCDAPSGPNLCAHILNLDRWSKSRRTKGTKQ